MDTGWEDLANAIIAQAAEDWMWAQRKLQRRPNNWQALQAVRETETFFRSRWFGRLSGANPEYVIRKLKEEMEK